MCGVRVCACLYARVREMCSVEELGGGGGEAERDLSSLELKHMSVISQ